MPRPRRRKSQARPTVARRGRSSSPYRWPPASGRENPKRDPLPLGAEPPEAKDLGLVDAVRDRHMCLYCKNEHFNDPDARYCAVCGVSMSQLTKIRQQGERPPLGVLILADGSVCQVDADYVMGREPTLDSAVAEGRARPLRLMGAPGIVSRIHARVESTTGRSRSPTSNPQTAPRLVLPGEQNRRACRRGADPPGGRHADSPGRRIRTPYDSHRHR